MPKRVKNQEDKSFLNDIARNDLFPAVSLNWVLGEIVLEMLQLDSCNFYFERPILERVGFFYLRVNFSTYSWSFLLTVNWLGLFDFTVAIWFGHFCLWWNIGLVTKLWSLYLQFPPVRKLGLVFFAYGSPRPEIGFGLFCLRSPPLQVKETNRK